ncbi:MAG: hypothetical protein FWB93_01215 [Oscillospiraceae bacterium]|nr:hypothetical protein [Oscillospiraceae bacterium]
MIKLKFSLEYKCNPIWILDDDGDVIENCLPDVLIKDKRIAKYLHEISEQFDSLYEDNELNFEFLGFSNETEKKVFYDKVTQTINLIKTKIDRIYSFETKVLSEDYWLWTKDARK